MKDISWEEVTLDEKVKSSGKKNISRIKSTTRRRGIRLRSCKEGFLRIKTFKEKKKKKHHANNKTMYSTLHDAYILYFCFHSIWTNKKWSSHGFYSFLIQNHFLCLCKLQDSHARWCISLILRLKGYSVVQKHVKNGEQVLWDILWWR